MKIRVVLSDLYPLPPSFALKTARRYLEEIYTTAEVEVTRGRTVVEVDRVQVSVMGDKDSPETFLRATKAEVCKVVLELMLSHWEA